MYFQYGLGPAQIGVMFLIPSAIIIIMAPIIGHLIDVYPVSTLSVIFLLRLNSILTS